MLWTNITLNTEMLEIFVLGFWGRVSISGVNIMSESILAFAL